MQRKTLLTGGVIAMTAALVFAGCQQVQQPQKSPEQVVQDGMKNLTSVTSHKFEFGINADLTGPQGETPQKVKFNFTLGGSVDLKDTQDPKINLTLDGSGNADDQSGAATAELRMNKDALYFMLSKLTTQGGQPIPQEFTTQYVGKWWKITIPPDALQQLTTSLPEGGNSQQAATPEEQQAKDKMKALFESTKFFKNIQFVGTESIKGQSSFHYTVDFDKDAFMAFAQQAAIDQGQPMADTDIQDMKDTLNKVEITGNLWIDQATGIMDQVSGDIKFVNPGPQDPSGTMSIRVTLWDFNKPVTVEVPAGATEFPVQELMGAMLGAPTTGTTGLDQSMMNSDSSMMDYSSMMTQQQDMMNLGQ